MVFLKPGNGIAAATIAEAAPVILIGHQRETLLLMVKGHL
jgi:hypothetical protein